ncbi:hypothetical protein N9Y89_00435 [bacterium]|nr:hypothetical protein [bacterium]
MFSSCSPKTRTNKDASIHLHARKIEFIHPARHLEEKFEKLVCRKAKLIQKCSFASVMDDMLVFVTELPLEDYWKVLEDNTQ